MTKTSGALDFIAMQLGGYFALGSDASEISPQHFAAAVCRIPDCVVSAVLKSNGDEVTDAEASDARAEVAFLRSLFLKANLDPSACGLAMVKNEQLWELSRWYGNQPKTMRRRSPQLRQAYEHAEAALKEGDDRIRSYHVLAALLRDGEGPARFDAHFRDRFLAMIKETNPRDQKKSIILAELDQLHGLASVKERVREQIVWLEMRAQMQALDPRSLAATFTANYLFIGNPGTGKTTVAMLMGRIYRALGILPEEKVVRSVRSDLVSQYIGESAVWTRKKIEEAIGGVLLIDDAYGLVQSEGDSNGKEAINTLNDQMYELRGKLVVIMAGYEQPLKKTLSCNPGLSGRFDYTILFPDFTPLELAAIFEAMATKHGHRLTPEFTERLLVHVNYLYADRRVDFGNAREMEKLLRYVEGHHAMKLNARPGPKSEDQLRSFTAADLPSEHTDEIESFLSGTRPFAVFCQSCGKEHQWVVEAPHHPAACSGCGKQMEEQHFGVATTGAYYVERQKEGALLSAGTAQQNAWDELNNMTGLDTLKGRLRAICDQAAVNLWRIRDGSNPLTPKLHMVFTGNSGAGKTTAARMVGRILKAGGVLRKGHCVEATDKDLIGLYKGWSGPQTFSKIEEALDGVLFVDEAYGIAPDRREENDFGGAVIVTLLKALDDFADRLVVIVAGYPNPMERFLRSNEGLRSRFPQANHFFFPDYTGEELLDMFRQIATKHNMVPEAALLQEVRRYLDSERARLGKDFGNGRLVSNLFEFIAQQQASRLRRESPPGGPSSEALRSLKREDLPAIDHTRAVLASADANTSLDSARA